jgi:hypothetical protein
LHRVFAKIKTYGTTKTLEFMDLGFSRHFFMVSLGFEVLCIHALMASTNLALGIATIAIITRSIFRAIELSDGFGGELANNEVLYMILEPPMISLAVIALTLCHLGVCFQGTWSSAKSAYKNGRDKLHSKHSDVETD